MSSQALTVCKVALQVPESDPPSLPRQTHFHPSFSGIPNRNSGVPVEHNPEDGLDPKDCPLADPQTPLTTGLLLSFFFSVNLDITHPGHPP
jgi:hypothetical protein